VRLFCGHSGALIKQYMNDIKKELFRKSIHICSAFVPVLLHYQYKLCLILLAAAGITYTAAELCRLRGIKIPVVSAVTEVAARKRDENRFVLGPLTLVVGILVTAMLYPQRPAAVGILSLAFGDGLASLAGKLFGNVHIPGTHGKTAAGSLTCFTAIFCAVFLYTGSTKLALIIAGAGMFIEVLPMKDLDNIVIPICLGGITCFIGA